MKLATFVENNQERFGVILAHPATGEDWVFEPNRVQSRFNLYALRGTSPYNANPPHFFDNPLPTSLAGFLTLGLFDELRRMTDFLRRFLEQADQYVLRGAGFPLSTVTLKAPIPRPRLFFGLVQNSPTAWRSRPERTHLNLFPQGHQRPQGSVLNPYDPIVLPDAETIVGGWNPELGVIIGRGGRDIPVDKAMAHVAGLTIVSDVTYDYFRHDYFAQVPPHDWFEDAMTSWGDKKSDARTPMGPYLVTLEEIGNPYDLLIYTRQSGLLRDRSHTGAMALGIERTIHWLSQFMTLYPGDVIHMGTMGYDGSPHLSEFAPTSDDFIESEIEKLGVLRSPLVVDRSDLDWRETNEASRKLHPAPAVRDLLNSGDASILRQDWTVEGVRHVWLLFGNYTDAEAQEGMKPRPYPRFLCAPNGVLAPEDTVIQIPPTVGEIWLGCELAFVISQLASQVTRENAHEHILGYMPMLSVYDTSFEDRVIEPASMQERHAPQVYGRWRDGFNVVGMPQPLKRVTAGECRVAIKGIGSVQGSTADYMHTAVDVVAYITQYITLFPGDVVTLGRLGNRLRLPRGTKADGTAAVDGVGDLAFRIEDMRTQL